MLFILLVLTILPIIIFYGIFIILQTSEKKHQLQKKFESTHYILPVKNCADSIEGIVRSIIWQFLTGKSPQFEIVILDMGSQDNTPEISAKLAQEYDFIHPMCKDEYIELINKMF